MKTNTDTGFEVSNLDVYNEFAERVAEKYKIPKFKSKVSFSSFNFYSASVDNPSMSHC